MRSRRRRFYRRRKKRGVITVRYPDGSSFRFVGYLSDFRVFTAEEMQPGEFVSFKLDKPL